MTFLTAIIDSASYFSNTKFNWVDDSNEVAMRDLETKRVK